MKTRLVLAFLLIAMTVLSAGGAPQNGHTLFGDLKVDDSKVQGIKPETFHLVLYNANRQEIGRERVSSGGRYRFLGLGNGEYEIAVLVGNDEITRIHVYVMELQNSDIRKDIELQWANKASGSLSNPQTVAADACNHTPANEGLFKKAADHLKNKNYDPAISLLNQIVTSDPKDCVAWTELGTAYFRKGNLDDADKSYQRALQERPSYLAALVNLGKLRLARKNFEGAIESLTLALKEQPLSADVNLMVGEAYLQIKKGSKAVGYLNEALRLDPIGKAEAHLRLAALYKGAGLKEKAAAEYEQFLAKRPDYQEKEALQQYIKANKKP
ncbi:MAG: tetratricopeptide repeat protein [Acidobacteriota bacterium]